MHGHSAGLYGGAEGFCALSQPQELPSDLVAMEKQSFAEAAILFAVEAIAEANGYTIRQQITIWSPFR